MCGIVGAVAQRNVAEILLEGLKRLEYRGYDSAGMSLVDLANSDLRTTKTVGKVAKLVQAAAKERTAGQLGIAHTRWATHGKITRANAHPHVAGGRIALVHNGIIENHDSLRRELAAAGCRFVSDTDTEVIAHLIHQALMHGESSLLRAVEASGERLRGAYGLCVIDRQQPDRLVVARNGMSLVIGDGIGGENFVALRPAGAGPGHRPLHLSRGRRPGAIDQRFDRSLERRPPGPARNRDFARRRRRSGQGRLPAFHAKGDFRAAPGYTRHAVRPASAKTAPWKSPSASGREKSSTRSNRCKLSPAAPASMPD